MSYTQREEEYTRKVHVKTTLNKSFKEIKKRYVKSFIDVIIATILAEKTSWGYGIIAEIYEKLNILLSPGNIYPILYEMEQTGLIRGYEKCRKRFYEITEEGVRWLNEVLDVYRATCTTVDAFLLSKRLGEN